MTELMDQERGWAEAASESRPHSAKPEQHLKEARTQTAWMPQALSGAFSLAASCRLSVQTMNSRSNPRLEKGCGLHFVVFDEDLKITVGYGRLGP